MAAESIHTDERKTDYKVYFFAGGEAGNNRFNIFTGSYIRLMDQIMGDRFEIMKGIHFTSPAKNVLWALSNSQKPLTRPDKNRFLTSAASQIIGNITSPDTQIIITSSSTGSIVAAQTVCFLTSINIKERYFRPPLHLALGTSIISPESELFKQLVYLQNKGEIGVIIHDELQDQGDNTNGAGGTTRIEAYRNAAGLLLPGFSGKYSGPSFLNSHPVNGHLHRKRAQTVQKALDYINVIMVQYQLAGEQYSEKAKRIMNSEEKY